MSLPSPAQRIAAQRSALNAQRAAIVAAAKRAERIIAASKGKR